MNLEHMHTLAMRSQPSAPLVRARPVKWAHLRKAQKEDEDRQRAGGWKKMPKLKTNVHINRTSYAALKVDLAIHVMSMDNADSLRLRRYSGWK